MEIALEQNNEHDFEEQFNCVQNYFHDSDAKVLSWQVIEKDGTRTKQQVNATVDDWRIAWACATAPAKGKISEHARACGKLIATNLAAGIIGLPPELYDFPSGKPQSQGKPIPLFYLHLPAMKSWSKEVPPLEPILQLSRTVMQGGMIDGRVAKSWNPGPDKLAPGTYNPSDRDDESLITLLFLQADNKEDPHVKAALDLRMDVFERSGHTLS